MQAEDTLVAVLDHWRKQGYTDNFMKAGKLTINPEDFNIDDIHRFEGMTDLEDESVLYAISSKDGKQKGILVNAYGIYSDETLNRFLEKMTYVHSKKQSV